jgi:hypothetical protein
MVQAGTPQPTVAPKPQGFFDKVGNFFSSIGNWFAGVFASKEANAVYHAALAGAVTYGSFVVSGQAKPTWLGLGGALVGGVIGYLRGDGNQAKS